MKTRMYVAMLCMVLLTNCTKITDVLNQYGGGAGGGNTNTPPQVITPVNWVDTATWEDNGYYIGFPQMTNAYGDSLEMAEAIWKEAGNHANGGWVTLCRISNGGRSLHKGHIKIDGVERNDLTNYCFNRLKSGRLNLVVKTASGSIIVCHRDNTSRQDTGLNFTSTQVLNLDVAGSYKTYPCPIKLVITPEGNTLLAMYNFSYGISAHPSEGVVWESKDNGQTYQFKSKVFSHTGAVTNANIGNWRGNEFALILAENTGIDSTSKYITLTRPEIPNDGGTSPFHIRSGNGCKTWEKTPGATPGSFVNDINQTITNNNPGLSNGLFYPFLAKNAPMDGMIHKGKVLIVHGERNVQFGYALKYTTYKTIAGAWSNKWNEVERPTLVDKYYAGLAGRSTDCGYSIVASLGEDHAGVVDYDVSYLPIDPSKSAIRRTRIRFRKLY